MAAGLQRNLTQSWTYHGLYDSGNSTMTDEAWENINIDAGSVALDSSYAEEMGLPRAQEFPWDRSKGLYYLNGYHNLHCLVGPSCPSSIFEGFHYAHTTEKKEIRISYNRFRDGLPQNLDVSHILHCFDSLRQDIICNADDVPRYSGFQPSGSTGRGQKHQCRDWNQLEEWANANTACWRYIQDSSPDFHLIEQYKFCPPGSPYAAKVAEVFGSNFGK